MKAKTSEKIIEYLSKNTQASGKELTVHLETITSRAVRKQLKNLFEKGYIKKIGRPPKVYYTLAAKKKDIKNVAVDKNVFNVINKRYLFISPNGEAKKGWEGFLLWCNKTKQNPIKTAHGYIKTLKKFDSLKKDNLIDGMPKMKRTFSYVYLDKLFYLDFYSIERFGKTKLGQMLLYAKQSQNVSLIRDLIAEIKPKIYSVIGKYNIDGVLFVPPTVKREVQFMKVFEEQLKLPVKLLSVTKAKTEIIIPQKTLSRLDDRIENVKQTIIVDEKARYKNILLIDDAVGSGATLNEIAEQIKNKNLARKKVIGLAITGSFKGFDIISEV